MKGQIGWPKYALIARESCEHQFDSAKNSYVIGTTLDDLYYRIYYESGCVNQYNSEKFQKEQIFNLYSSQLVGYQIFGNNRKNKANNNTTFLMTLGQDKPSHDSLKPVYSVKIFKADDLTQPLAMIAITTTPSKLQNIFPTLLAAHNDGTHFAVGFSDHSISVYATNFTVNVVSSCALIASFPPYTNPITHLYFSSNNVRSSSSSSSLLSATKTHLYVVFDTSSTISSTTTIDTSTCTSSGSNNNNDMKEEEDSDLLLSSSSPGVLVIYIDEPVCVSSSNNTVNYSNNPSQNVSSSSSGSVTSSSAASIIGLTLSAAISKKSTNITCTSKVLDSHGGIRHCAVYSADTSSILIGRKDGIFQYTVEDRGSAVAIEGVKSYIHQFKRYTIVVTQDEKSSRQSVTCYDLQNKFIAGSFQVPINESVLSISSHAGVCYLLLNTGSLLILNEKDIAIRISLLCQKLMYPLAIIMGAEDEVDVVTLMKIYEDYAYYLYTKNSYDESIQQYCHTIGYTPTSTVIRLYSDYSKLSYLVTYLEKLHDKGLADKDHTTLLLNCYIKLNDEHKINHFIDTNHKAIYAYPSTTSSTPSSSSTAYSSSTSTINHHIIPSAVIGMSPSSSNLMPRVSSSSMEVFDVNEAITLLHKHGYTDQALKLSLRHHKFRQYASIQLTKSSPDIISVFAMMTAAIYDYYKSIMTTTTTSTTTSSTCMSMYDANINVNLSADIESQHKFIQLQEVIYHILRTYTNRFLDTHTDLYIKYLIILCTGNYTELIHAHRGSSNDTSTEVGGRNVSWKSMNMTNQMHSTADITSKSTVDTQSTATTNTSTAPTTTTTTTTTTLQNSHLSVHASSSSNISSSSSSDSSTSLQEYILTPILTISTILPLFAPYSHIYLLQFLDEYYHYKEQHHESIEYMVLITHLELLLEQYQILTLELSTTLSSPSIKSISIDANANHLHMNQIQSASNNLGNTERSSSVQNNKESRKRSQEDIETRLITLNKQIMRILEHDLHAEDLTQALLFTTIYHHELGQQYIYKQLYNNTNNNNNNTDSLIQYYITNKYTDALMRQLHIDDQQQPHHRYTSEIYIQILQYIIQECETFTSSELDIHVDEFQTKHKTESQRWELFLTVLNMITFYDVVSSQQVISILTQSKTLPLHIVSSYIKSSIHKTQQDIISIQHQVDEIQNNIHTYIHNHHHHHQRRDSHQEQQQRLQSTVSDSTLHTDGDNIDRKESTINKKKSDSNIPIRKSLNPFDEEEEDDDDDINNDEEKEDAEEVNTHEPGEGVEERQSIELQKWQNIYAAFQEHSKNNEAFFMDMDDSTNGFETVTQYFGKRLII